MTETACVLVIDDEVSQRRGIARSLKHRGYDVIEAEGGENVEKLMLEHAKTLRACALDMTLLPGRRTGMETLRAIRHFDPTLPVLVFTGDQERYGEEAVIAGANLFMRKPYETKDLIVAIDSLVTMHTLRRSVIATENELSLLRTALDAINIGITISDATGNVILENTTRKRWSGKGEEVRPQRTAWFEAKDHGRSLWRNQTEVSFVGRPGFQVTTELEVTRWKIIENIRQELILLANTLTREQLIEKVADWLHEDFHYSRIRIWLCNEKSMSGQTSRGMDGDFVMKGCPFRMDDELSLRAIRESHPFLLTWPDFEKDSRFKEFRMHGIRTQLQVPLVAAAGVFGLISIDDVGSPRDLTIEDQELMTVFGAMVVDAIQVVDMNEERTRREQWAQALNTIDEPLTSGSGLAAVFEVMGHTLASIVGADQGVIFTRQGPEGPLTIVSVIDRGDPNLLGMMHDGHGMIGECMQARSTIFEPDIWERDGFQRRYSESNNPIWRNFLLDAKSVVVEPILCGSEVIGVLFLRSPERMSINVTDKAYLNAVAKRVSIALAKLDESQRLEATLIQQSKLHDMAMLAAGVAHGIKNPLTTIVFALDSLAYEFNDASGLVDPLTLWKKIETIRTATERSLRTLTRLTDWCSPQGSTLGPINLKELVLELIEIVRDDMEYRGILVDESFMRDDLPWIRGAKDQLRMALADLFWNAEKAMPHGGQLFVSLELSDDQKNLNLSIIDTGVGMSEQSIREHTSIRPFSSIPPGGSGLGLYLCRKILTAHGGALRIKSIVNQGTTMTIVLPVLQSNDQGVSP